MQQLCSLLHDQPLGGHCFPAGDGGRERGPPVRRQARLSPYLYRDHVQDLLPTWKGLARTRTLPSCNRMDQRDEMTFHSTRWRGTIASARCIEEQGRNVRAGDGECSSYVLGSTTNHHEGTVFQRGGSEKREGRRQGDSIFSRHTYTHAVCQHIKCPQLGK